MTVAEILQQFPSRRALVAGDICLDRWCTYDPDEAEPSRETGIPRTAVIATETTPGAGGTVANNLAALGCGEIAVLGVIGNDGNGYELRQALKARGIRLDLLIEADGWSTFTYTKLLNRETGNEDLPRIDFINTRPLPDLPERRVAAELLDAAPDFDVILVSDQAETNAGGVVTAAVRDAVSQIALQYPEKVVWVDSRLRPEHFRYTVVKPNEDEAAAACRRVFGEVDYARLRAHTQSPLLIVTHGKRGALLHTTAADPQWIDSIAIDNPIDICGAGDSFSAGASLAYSVTRDPAASANIGNLVASITIMKKGTGTATPAEVLIASAHPTS
ncbi:MAG: ribokinase [Acidobacteria bacterium]|nr:ribokinase [Acidobacteriota bacterium]